LRSKNNIYITKAKDFPWRLNNIYITRGVLIAVVMKKSNRVNTVGESPIKKKSVDLEPRVAKAAETHEQENGTTFKFTANRALELWFALPHEQRKIATEALRKFRKVNLIVKPA
jgi:adenine-specific DNA glycosylase